MSAPDVANIIGAVGVIWAGVMLLMVVAYALYQMWDHRGPIAEPDPEEAPESEPTGWREMADEIIRKERVEMIDMRGFNEQD